MGTWFKYGPILFKYTKQIECFKEGLKTEFERDSAYSVNFMGIYVAPFLNFGHPSIGTWSEHRPMMFKLLTLIYVYRKGL